MQHQETQNLEAFTLIPADMTFKQALRAGYVKPYRNRNYLDFIKTLPCCGCGSPADDPHHIISVGLGGGMGTKPSDFPYAIPLCRPCHTLLHADVAEWEDANGSQALFALLTVHQALDEGIIDI